MSGGKKWRFVWQDETYREADLTIAQAEKVEDLLGLSWLQINPLRSAKQARGILAVLHAERTGKTIDEAMGELADVTVERFIVDIFHLDDDTDPEVFANGNPPVADASSTPG